ncbi:DUF551 domain-containing protein [Enterobacter roggenkampii]|nr:DUF551 domain-containing protein [Enterobacter roggenkampii]
MSTITKERVAEFIKNPLNNGLTRGEQMELARIALASLEADPVAWLLSGGGAKNNVSFDSGNAYVDPMREVTPLYTAPPAPVSVPDEVLKRLLPDAEKAEFWFEHDGKILFEGVKFNNAVFEACRAAMLQGAEPVSNHDELPLDYLQGHKDGLEWAAQLAEASHPHTGDWLYDDPVELAKAIRKGPDMPELKSVPADADDNFYSWFCREWEQHYQPNQYSLSAKKHLGAIAESAWFACRGAMLQSSAGNSPVIPDGWVACSERMPDDDDFVHIWPRPDFGVELHVGQYCECHPKGDGWYAQVYEQNYGIEWCPITVTHWMPLPAAPQQEVTQALAKGMERYGDAMQKLADSGD